MKGALREMATTRKGLPQVSDLLSRALTSVGAIGPIRALGLGLIALLGALLLNRLQGRSFDQLDPGIAYIVLGAVLPVLALATVAGQKLSSQIRRYSDPFLGLLGLAGLLAGGALVSGSMRFTVILLSASQAALLMLSPGFSARPAAMERRSFARDPLFLGILAFFWALACWCATIRLAAAVNVDSLRLDSGRPFWILAGTFGFCSLTLSSLPDWRAIHFPARAERWLTGVGLAALAFVACRTGLWIEGSWSSSPLLDPAGSFVGPVELVRQGGWLLWDTPSRHGFLDALVMAWLPTRSAWRSLVYLKCSLAFASAAVLFLLLRRLGGGIPNLLMALAASIASIWLQSGWMPVAGALPFIGCYLLIAFLCLVHDRETAPLWPGHLIFGIGALWSLVSLLCCAALWLPACVTFAIRRKSWKPPAAALGLLGLMVMMISGYYRFRLGHLPDWRCLSDQALALKADLGSPGFEPKGSVWLFFLVLCAIGGLLMEQIGRGTGRGLAICAGCWGVILATGALFVGRLNGHQLTGLLPLQATSLIALLLLLRRERIVGVGPELVRILATCVLTVSLAMSWGEAGVVDRILGSDWEATGVQSMPTPLQAGGAGSRELRQLMETAGVRPEDPMIGLLSGDAPDWSTRRDGIENAGGDPSAWLPLGPADLLASFSPERQITYLRRFAARRSWGGGWLLTSRAPDGTEIRDSRQSVIRSWIEANYQATRSFEGQRWILRWYSHRQ